jgi:hypothetical protein
MGLVFDSLGPGCDMAGVGAGGTTRSGVALGLFVWPLLERSPGAYQERRPLGSLS